MKNDKPNDEVLKELDGIVQDNFVFDMRVDRERERLINELAETSVFDEVPVKRKYPLRVRFKQSTQRFFNKIKNMYDYEWD